MADSDYDPTVFDQVTITLDRNTPKEGACFNMSITADSRVESDETFTISLDAIPGRITLNDTTRQALVTIVNDDGKHIPLATMYKVHALILLQGPCMLCLLPCN